MVERIFMQVNVSRRECEMQLDNKDFDERAQNYRRKKWIEDGQDPDEMENKWKTAQKQKQKQRKMAEKEYLAKKKAEREASASNKGQIDERFANINKEKFERKKKSKDSQSTDKPTDQKTERKQLPLKNPLKLSINSKTIGKNKTKRNTLN